jgi:hypothetical protein
MSRDKRARNASSYRSQKARRIRRKLDLIVALGGRCVDCGYAGYAGALDFHHRDPSSKKFALSTFSGSLVDLEDEAVKCDLLCAICHRLRHLAAMAGRPGTPVVTHRRRRKERAVFSMGAACYACERRGPPVIFDFHHRDAKAKSFGVQDGNTRSWQRIAAELAKCVMLCANCHREVHAGVRELDEGLLGLAEDALAYVA